jgi:protein SCO1/2
MSARAVAICAASLAGVFVSCLVGVMIYLYASSPKIGQFDEKFSLIDDHGQPVNESIFHGYPALVYFGYTNCPEVCPTTLFEVTDWLNAIGPQGKDLKAFFFSVDPERDTPDIMHEYVDAFGDRITGVTGKLDEMRKVMDGWMIHAEKLPSEGGNYHMSHTITLLMIGADGRLKGLIPYGTDRDEAISKIKSVLLKHRGGTV